MERRVLGKSGIEASNIGLGTYYFGGGDGTSPPCSKDIIDMIHSALDHSINLLDTAPSYGTGDEFSFGAYIPVGEDSADFWWYNWQANFDEMEAGNANWQEKGNQMQAKFDETATCAEPTLYNGMEFYRASVAS